MTRARRRRASHVPITKDEIREDETLHEVLQSFCEEHRKSNEFPGGGFYIAPAHSSFTSRGYHYLQRGGYISNYRWTGQGIFYSLTEEGHAMISLEML